MSESVLELVRNSRTVVVGTDFESLVPSHDQASLAILLVFEQPHVAGTSLLPLSAVSVELEEFGPHLEGLLFGFFVSLGVDLLRQTDNRFEVDVGFLFFVFLLLSC